MFSHSWRIPYHRRKIAWFYKITVYLLIIDNYWSFSDSNKICFYCNCSSLDLWIFLNSCDCLDNTRSSSQLPVRFGTFFGGCTITSWCRVFDDNSWYINTSGGICRLLCFNAKTALSISDGKVILKKSILTAVVLKLVQSLIYIFFQLILFLLIISPAEIVIGSLAIAYRKKVTHLYVITYFLFVVYLAVIEWSYP